MNFKNQQVYQNEDIGVLVGGTAHDLNNLLTGAQLQAAIAIRKLSSENPAATHITKVIEAMEHMTMYVNNLLSHTKGGQMRSHIELNSLVNKCVNISSLIIGEDVQLDLNLSPELPDIFADKIQLQQMILNLILNAAESLHPSSNGILVSTGWQPSLRAINEPGWWVTGDRNCSNEAVFVEVRDGGRGISRELLHRVFDPYYSTKDEGRGLGLPLVLEVVRSHQGHLLVHSNQGQGTVFKVFFPVGRSEKKQKSTVLNGWVR